VRNTPWYLDRVDDLIRDDDRETINSQCVVETKAAADDQHLSTVARPCLAAIVVTADTRDPAAFGYCRASSGREGWSG
jgi:hypothetical protein